MRINVARKREVLVLLRDYRAYHTPFGGAMPVDETGMMEANYGTAGYIESGQYFTEAQREDLKPSYEALDRALVDVQDAGPLGMAGYLVLLGPYLGDPGDPALVEKWRRKKSALADWHDATVDHLAWLLRNEDLYVVWPKRMSTRVSKKVDEMNDEVWRLYLLFRAENRSKTYSVKTTADMMDYSERRVWEIVRLRELELDEADDEGSK